jgi:hypothetical protein
MKKGKGIFGQIKSAEIKSEITIKDFEDMLSILDKPLNSRQKLECQIGGNEMLRCTDEIFKFYWAFENLTVLANTDTYNKILDRAKQLGIIHKHNYIKQ